MPAVSGQRKPSGLRAAQLTQILPTGLLVGETRLDLGQIPRIIFHFPTILASMCVLPESSELPSASIDCRLCGSVLNSFNAPVHNLLASMCNVGMGQDSRKCPNSKARGLQSTIPRFAVHVMLTACRIHFCWFDPVHPSGPDVVAGSSTSPGAGKRASIAALRLAVVRRRFALRCSAFSASAGQILLSSSRRTDLSPRIPLNLRQLRSVFGSRGRSVCTRGVILVL